MSEINCSVAGKNIFDVLTLEESANETSKLGVSVHEEGEVVNLEDDEIRELQEEDDDLPESDDDLPEPDINEDEIVRDPLKQEDEEVQAIEPEKEKKLSNKTVLEESTASSSM